MNSSRDNELLKWQEAVQEGASESAPDSHDPSIERIWDASRGNLPPAETRELLDRVVKSPAHARAWSAARAISQYEKDEYSENVRPEFKFRAWRGWLSAAAVIVAISGVAVWMSMKAPFESNLRGERATIESLIPDDAALPRTGAALRWQGPPGVVEYNIRVFREDLEPLVVEEGLDGAVFVLPESVVTNIGRGETVLWQVEAVFGDGKRALSETFKVRIGEKSETP